MREKVYQEINKVLMQWDPINIAEIGGPIDTEYSSYIPSIIENSNNLDDLMNFLESILQELASAYDKNNPNHKNHLISICEQIISIIKFNQ